MSLRKQAKEIERLIDVFSIEANKFHEIKFSSFILSQGIAATDIKFSQPHHAIMLWQYYGALSSEIGINQFVTDLAASDLQWGLRGAQLSSFAVIEGETTPLFVRMAKRASSIFNQKDTTRLKNSVIGDIILLENQRDATCKPTAVINDNPLAIWLNYLLYHISMTNPGREKLRIIEPDPFTLSLLALEDLAITPVISRASQNSTCLRNSKFKVSLSFPGERRQYVSNVAQILSETLGKEEIFYDYNYQAQLARPNIDVLLQDIYRNKSDLIVVFLCSEYARKQWCGLEWRAIRDIIKSREDDRVMFVKFDDAAIDGVFSIDGYIDARRFSEDDVARFVLERLSSIPH